MFYFSEQFNKGLEFMNRAVSGQRQPTGARENVAYLTSMERQRNVDVQSHAEVMSTFNLSNKLILLF